MAAYAFKPTLQDAHRTYVRVATSSGGIDGVGATNTESYRALHAIFHPPSFPHVVLGGRASAQGSSSSAAAAAAASSNEVAMDTADAPSKALKRGAAAVEEAPAANKKAKPAEPAEVEMEEEDVGEEDDWKATMYYWRGTLSFAAETLTWKGAWVGSRAGLPPDSEFASSPNEFTLTAPAKVKGGVTLAATAAELKPAAIKGKFVGKYLLDQGDGLENFQDKAHMFKISSCEDGSVMVCARGTTEFGAFVSAGKLESASGGAMELTLARRYVDDADPRKKWTTADKVADQLLAAPGAAGAPWTSAAMKMSLS